MPNANVNGQGKSGTVTAAEFEALSAAVSQWGAKVLAQKVAKICSKKAALLTHEFPSSTIAAAYMGISTRILGGLGSESRPISALFFTTLTNMVATYGPEVVVLKLAKIAGKTGASAEKTSLSALFPKSGAALTGGVVRPGAVAARRSY